MALAPLEGLASLGDDTCRALRGHFLSVGFSAGLVAEADAVLPGTLRTPRLPVIRFWLERRPEAGAMLARLFVFDDTVPEAAARGALGTELFDALSTAGIVASESAGVRSRFLLAPTLAELFVLSDPLGAGRDAAMGPGGGTEHLARLVPSGFRGSALDLGCGAGTLALVAARSGARRSVGVDLNARAVELARFNARLNGLAVEFRAGDGAEPVREERFDLVLSQPPFVGRPPQQNERTFLFGGDRGDELPLRLLGEAARLLSPGGRAMFLIQSAERDDEPLMVRVQKALSDTNSHVLVLAGSGPTPATQASVFAALEDPTLGEKYAAAARRYLEHFATRDVRAFSGALVVVTQPAAELGDGRYALGLSLRGPSYDALSLAEFLRGLDVVEAPDELLERQRLRLSEHASVTAAGAPTDPESPAGVLRIAPPGIGTDWPLATAELEILSAIDAAETAGAALDAVTRAAPGLAALRQELRSFVRSALLRGALVRR